MSRCCLLGVWMLVIALSACEGGNAPPDGARTDGGGSGGYRTECAEMAALFFSASDQRANDWSGYWRCWQQTHGCSGSTCSFTSADLDAYVLDDDCAAGATQSCTIGGATVPHCREQTNAGHVDVDCSASGSITLRPSGFPDHSVESYAGSGSLPPLLGTSAQTASYTITTTPVYADTVSVFTSAGAVLALTINGVGYFNQFSGIGAVAVNDEIVDDCSGHPAMGTYHYHSIPRCGRLATDPSYRGSDGAHSGLMGLALDGFPIFGPFGYSDARDASSGIVRMRSCYVQGTGCNNRQASCYVFDRSGYEAGTCHLDECNGRISAVPPGLDRAFGGTIYAYYLTIDESGDAAFPYVPYCYRGEYSRMDRP